MCNVKSFAPKCKNIGGVKKRLHYIPVSELTASPTTVAATKLAATPAQVPALGDELLYDSAWATVATVGLGYFRTIDIHTETGEVKTTAAGNPGELVFPNSLDFAVKGYTAAAKQLARDLATCCGGFVFIVEDRNGSRQVLGKFGDGALLTASEGTTGVAATDSSRVSYTITTYDGEPCYEYPSPLVIDTTPNA